MDVKTKTWAGWRKNWEGVSLCEILLTYDFLCTPSPSPFSVPFPRPKGSCFSRHTIPEGAAFKRIPLKAKPQGIQLWWWAEQTFLGGRAFLMSYGSWNMSPLESRPENRGSTVPLSIRVIDQPLQHKHPAVNQVWCQLGSPGYSSLGGARSYVGSHLSLDWLSFSKEAQLWC